MKYVFMFAAGLLAGMTHSYITADGLSRRVQSFNARVDYYETELGNCWVRIDELERTIKKMNSPINIEDIVTTNRIYIMRDPLDNMPMYGVDPNGGLAL
jgi:hypothetical protein